LGFVHHSRTIFCRAVPNLSITIRNFCIAVRLACDDAVSRGTDNAGWRGVHFQGGVESLMEWRYKHDATVAVGLLRVSVGLEAPRDLINDIRQGVTRALKQQGRAASKPRGRALLANPNIHGGPVNHVA
jgi:hypothetical protein